MPLYTYTCPDCKLTLDRTATMAERDNQTCTNERTVTVIDELALNTITQIRRIKRSHEDTGACGGKLEREEIPMDQGRMSYNWSK